MSEERMEHPVGASFLAPSGENPWQFVYHEVRAGIPWVVIRAFTTEQEAETARQLMIADGIYVSDVSDIIFDDYLRK
jgi:hypothetical protein